MTKKILLMGKASTGKTSIKKAIFEGITPETLMIKPLEPTRGIVNTSYEWMDLDVSLFDSSGQEIMDLFENTEQENRAFDQTDAVIYIFDYALWLSSPQEIIDEIHKLYNLLHEKYEQAMLILVLHKIDLINLKLRTRLSHIKKKILSFLNLPSKIPLYSTSIYPKMIYNTYNAFFKILSSLSEETRNLKKILDTHLKFLISSICFITNQSNQVISQTMTNDFNVNEIHSVHEIIANLDHTTEELEAIYDNIHFFGLGNEIYNIIISNLETISSNFKNFICVSKLNNKNDLKEVVKSVKSDMSDFYEKH